MVQLLPDNIKIKATQNVFHVDIVTHVIDTHVRFPVIAKTLPELVRLLCRTKLDLFHDAPYYFIRSDLPNGQSVETKHNGSYNQLSNVSSIPDWSIFVCCLDGIWRNAHHHYLRNDGELEVIIMRFTTNGHYFQKVSADTKSPRFSLKFQLLNRPHKII
jgi:hypothetical protein